MPPGHGQNLAHRARILNLRQRLLGHQVAFGVRHLHEQQPLVGEVTVQRRLGDPRRPRDIIDAGALEAVGHEHLARAGKHLGELAPGSDDIGNLAH